MTTHYLRSIFTAVVYKKLAAVDLPGKSHQHEVNGNAALKRFFSTSEEVSGTIHWHFFSDESDSQNEINNFTFYDARARSADRTRRSEWRMYYYGGFLNLARPGDIMILAKLADNHVHGLVFEANSGWFRSARILFGLQNEILPQFDTLSEENLSEQELEFSRRQILEELGIEIELPILPGDEDLAIYELNRAEDEGRNFPSTQRMSELARQLVDVDYTNSDETLTRWLAREETIFRAIEKIVVQKKLTRGFESVDDFIKYSLSTQNRRKSRMGYALQNHLEQIFKLNHLQFQTQKTTEGKNKPDFLFPGQFEYLNPSFDRNSLVMLGVKSSCKDRWRQILTEANRVKNKHLCTLEQSISNDQTDEMKTHGVKLIIPAQLHNSYSDKQRNEIWSLNKFIELVRNKQSA